MLACIWCHRFTGKVFPPLASWPPKRFARCAGRRGSVSKGASVWWFGGPATVLCVRQAQFHPGLRRVDVERSRTRVQAAYRFGCQSKGRRGHRRHPKGVASIPQGMVRATPGQRVVRRLDIPRNRSPYIWIGRCTFWGKAVSMRPIYAPRFRGDRPSCSHQFATRPSRV